MFIEICRTRRAATERVNLGPSEAIKIVELHRRKRRAKFDQFFRRLVKFSAFVVGADDENAHVELSRSLNCRPVQIVDEIPMEIHVVEFAAVHRVQNDVGRSVRGKADEADASVASEAGARQRHNRSFCKDQFSNSRLLMP